MFSNVLDCISFINNIKVERRTSLDRMKEALEKLGNLENNFKKIHVGGTNGKGSTSMFIKNILIECGYNVGCFVSPYVVKFNERIQFNDSYISDEDLIIHTNKVYPIYEELHVSFFEFLSLVAISYFASKNVNYVIMEVGMGGLLDATNAINYDLSLITNIGLDHMEHLGNSLEEIAISKLGIVKENNHLITTVDESLHDLFKSYCDAKNAHVSFINKDDILIYPCEMCSFEFEEVTYDLFMLGNHQAFNASLAIKACKYLLPDIKKKRIKKALERTIWPGRLERVNITPRVILDGAHNILGITALNETIKHAYKNRNVKIIFCAMKDKETQKMIEILEETASYMVFTQIDYYRSSEALDLYNACKLEKKDLIVDPKEAVRKTIREALDDDIIIITGSLYFISLIRPMFR